MNPLNPRLQQLSDRRARQAHRDDLVDIYCELTGKDSFKGTTKEIREAIARALASR